MIYYLFIVLACVIGFGFFKYKTDQATWPSKIDFTAFVFGAIVVGGIEALILGTGMAGWAAQAFGIFVGILIMAYISTVVARLIAKVREHMLLYTQRCPQCDSKEVVNEEFTDIFDYGCDNGAQARLAVESVKHNCCNCGFTFTGYTNEQDRAQAVKNYLTR